MKFRYVIDVEVTRVQGKFAARDEISDELQQSFSDPGTLSVVDTEYEVTSFDVQEQEEPDPYQVLAHKHGMSKKEVREALKRHARLLDNK